MQLTTLFAVFVGFSAISPAGPTNGSRATSAVPPRIRVLSYNIHHGEGVDKKIDLERIAKVIRSVEPDIVALQEVDRNTRRSNNVDQPKELGRLTELDPVFERNIRFQDGDYGNAVLARRPVKRHKNHALPSHYQGEQRGVLEVELEIDVGGAKQPLLFLATHLDFRPAESERLASVKAIEELVLSRPDVPAILAGDLNALRVSETIKQFGRAWHIAGDEENPTFPSSHPVRQIDYVLCRPVDRWKVIEVRVLDEAVASDHRAIFAILELLPKAD